MKTIYLVRYNSTSPGVKVIVDAFSKTLIANMYNVTVSDSLPTSISDNDVLVTYGPKETYDAISNKLKVSIALLVDNYSLGQLNKAKFLIKKKKLWYTDLWYSLATAMLYRWRERVIAKKINNLMFVSKNDIKEFELRFPNNVYYLVPNGVKLPAVEDTLKTKSEFMRLGILSNWTDVTLQECKWFIEDILPHLKINGKQVQLVVAGKGASNQIVEYFTTNPLIRYMGKVEFLSTFFKNIDCYVATVPRGCGILNKVLDAFAYRTPVIGIPESFSGFSEMKDCFIECKSLSDFQNALDALKEKSLNSFYVENAYRYIIENNNWETNYNEFVSVLKQNKIL